MLSGSKRNRQGWILRRTALCIAVLLTVVAAAPHADAKRLKGTANNDILVGTPKDDALKGFDGTDLFVGGKGDDSLNGGAGANYFSGGPGKDKMVGGVDGEYFIDTDGKGGDTINAGGGNDYIYVADGAPSKVTCGDGFDVVLADEALDKVDLGTCNSVVTTNIADATNDWRFGTDAGETLSPDMKTVVVAFGKGGDDTLNAPATYGNGIWFPGPGADTVNGGTYPDYIYDDDHQPGDVLHGAGSGDTIVSLDGAIDTIDCGDNLYIDVVYADPDDIITGCSTEDLIYRVPGVNPTPE